MRRFNYDLRLLVVALFALALIRPVVRVSTPNIADTARSAANDDRDHGDDDEDNDERGPCRNALKHAAKALSRSGRGR